MAMQETASLCVQDVASRLDGMRLESAASAERQRAERQAAIRLGEHQLRAAVDALDTMLGEFSRAVISDFTSALSALDPTAQTLHVPYEPALAMLLDRLAADVERAAAESGVALPAPSLAGWVMYAEIASIGNPVSRLSSRLGAALSRPLEIDPRAKQVGENAARRMSAAIPGADERGRLTAEANRLVRAALPSLRRASAEQLHAALRTLRAAHEFYDSWLPPMPTQVALEARLEICQALIAWCDETTSAIDAHATEVIPSTEGER
jgi:hypothetical protein